MIILLSPAKSLDFDSPPPIGRSENLLFSEEADYLAGKLKKFSAKKLRSMMDISEKLAQLNAERYAHWSLPFSEGESKQAAFAFTGDVYQGLEAQTMNEADLLFAQEHLRILSGLYGILRPLDGMLPYRLEMGTDWAITPKKNSLYKFWKAKLTKRLKQDIAETKSSFLLNLASAEYSKAVDLKKLGIPVISPEFKEDRGDRFQMISFFAKKARGLMARYALENRITDPEMLKGFDLEGYHFNDGLSNTKKNKWVFTRIYKSNQ